MVVIIDKHNCCGCSACVQACPKQCISFDEDEQGFRYPLVNKELCIDCGLCEKVCPCLNQSEPRKPINVYAAINPNEEIRMKSSSGGIFTLLAEKIIDEGGVVFGARFDENWEVKHDYTENKEGLDVFRGSKYVQSRIGETFKQAQAFLDEGRKVLFSGTSCQIAGLKKFLRKEYINLITVDVVCHGVPSPLVWRNYLSDVKQQEDIKGVNFKNKISGWRQYSFSITGQDDDLNERSSANKYMLSYTKNYNIRPSCFHCPAKAGKCYSDITLADYWGIEKFIPQMDDNKGTSFVGLNSEKGVESFERVNCRFCASDYDNSTLYNPALVRSTKIPERYDEFWKDYCRKGITILDQMVPSETGICRVMLKKIKSIITNR